MVRDGYWNEHLKVKRNTSSKLRRRPRSNASRTAPIEGDYAKRCWRNGAPPVLGLEPPSPDLSKGKTISGSSAGSMGSQSYPAASWSRTREKCERLALPCKCWHG